MFTNTLLHAIAAMPSRRCTSNSAPGRRTCCLAYEDLAPPFDPLQYLASMPPREVEAVEAMVPGGQGLPLVAQMSERFDYEHIEGRNSARLSIRRQT